jgi:hypothetical protein
MASLDHPNILALAGARAFPPEYFILFPFQENGSLTSLIHEQGWRWGLDTSSLTVCSKFTCVPVHTRRIRILLPGLATRSLTDCSQCTGVAVHTCRILFSG